MMKSNNKILFVLEGTNPEDRIVENLQKDLLTDGLVTCLFNTSIYKLYKEIQIDEDLDLFNLLKEKPENQEKLNKYNRTDFSEIYLFFDYDGHCSNATDDKITEMLEYFNEETDKGKLYISYPMAEALNHIEKYENFKGLTFPIKEGKDYKKMVRQMCIPYLKSFKIYTLNTWKEVIYAHLQKMNYIVLNNYSFPNQLIEQNEIFQSQLEKYINKDKTVSVLSAFPVFLHDYYGNVKIKSLII